MMEDSKRKDLIEKLNKKLPESFVDDVRAADEKSLRDKIVELSKQVEDVVESMKNDNTLNSLKEQVKDLSGGYNDVKKEKRSRLKYILLTLEERGKL